MGRLIERDDYYEIRQLAKKYNMSIADFGRTIVRQAERREARAVRVTEAEYDHIKRTAEKNKMTMGQFLGLACRAYLQMENRSIPLKGRAEDGAVRTKRTFARIYSPADEMELMQLATEYGMAVTTLIRYCAMRFDGEKINV